MGGYRGYIGIIMDYMGTFRDTGLEVKFIGFSQSLPCSFFLGGVFEALIRKVGALKQSSSYMGRAWGCLRCLCAPGPPLDWKLVGSPVL